MQRLTSEAKQKLSATVRALRTRLCTDIGDEAESRWRLSIAAGKAGLDEGPRTQRKRLEEWLDEQTRSSVPAPSGNGRPGKSGSKETEAQARARHLKTAVTRAAATFFNRIITLRQMEALGLSRPPVATGGFQSAGWREFREYAPALLEDESEGYLTLLRLVFDEIAVDLPGLFGHGGIVEMFAIPARTVRAVVEALDDPELESAWGDDTTLGWVYQFWNDPDREALDEKIRNHGKIENHEIAAKTQLFTDRYIVEWMLQNSLGQIWFTICRKNGWIPEVVADGTLDRLEVRRLEWRGRRERGEVDTEALMPIEGAREDRWKYWVPRDIPTGDDETAVSTLRDLKILDPACGSGHFLVIAFHVLSALYEEEARHRGKSWAPGQIGEWIVERNLHGVDIDPRAVQIAAAAVWLKMRTYCRDAEPRTLSLVASSLELARLTDNDPALVELTARVQETTGIPADLTLKIVHALKGADYLGSLLKVDRAVDDAIALHEAGLSRFAAGQGDLFEGFRRELISGADAKVSILRMLDQFLARCTGGDDLGLRLRGEQLAAGVRFVRTLREGQYDLVIGNPPYQGASKMVDAQYYAEMYPPGKADTSASFLLRSTDLCTDGGFSLLLTIRGWLFIGQFEGLRNRLLNGTNVQLVGDFDQGAFSNEVGNLLSVSSVLMRKTLPNTGRAMAVLPTPFDVRWRNDNRRAFRKEAALLAGEGRYEFRPSHLQSVPGLPLVYWWADSLLKMYESTVTVGQICPARQGIATADDTRFLRHPWEIAHVALYLCSVASPHTSSTDWPWVPFIKGAEGKAWFEPLSQVLRWWPRGLQIKCLERDGRQASRPQNEPFYFRIGVAFSMISSTFSARIHRFCSVIGHKGSSVFPEDCTQMVCLMNTTFSRDILESLNPGVGFEVGDVNRLPHLPIAAADEIVAVLHEAFTEHEAAREPSMEFKHLGPSPWRGAQDWAQRAVDRPAGTPLPPYEPEYDPEPPQNHLSFALGVALGRFGPNGEGILDTPPADALPHGILYLSAYSTEDSLARPATRPLHDAWQTHGPQIAPRSDLRTYLREKFFPEVHRTMYENRPIHFPLSSQKRNFVAWISIHRWTDTTLQTLLGEYLNPEFARLEAELVSLLEATAKPDEKRSGRAEKRLVEVQNLREELRNFIDMVYQLAERGAPQAAPRDPAREIDARFRMDLDDGVMVNSAALWPLLDPQWKDPKKWWRELSRAEGKKDYDWSHLAARYFPTRVYSKCQSDPSLAVAHACFWKYHPEKAYQWELRLQDEISPIFTLDEPDSNPARDAFERDHRDRVQELRNAEEKRRTRKAGRVLDASDSANDLQLFTEAIEEVTL